MGVTNFSELETDAGPVATGERQAHIANNAALAADADLATTRSAVILMQTKMNSILDALREFGILETN